MSFRPLAAALILLIGLCHAGFGQETTVSTRARTLFRQRRYYDLIETVESARRRRMVTAEDLLLLSVAYANTGQPQRAQEALSEAEVLDPASSSVQLALGSLALEDDNLAEAVARFRTAHRLDPASETTVEVLSAALVNHGAALVKAGKRAEGAVLLTEAVELRPSSVVALRNLAILSLQDGDHLGAADLADRALLLAPTDVDLQRIRVEALRRTDSPSRLAAALRGLIEVRPQDAIALALLGRTLDGLGNRAEAVEAYSQAAVLGANDPMVYHRLGEDALVRDDRNAALSMTHLAITQSIQRASQLRLGAANSLENRELTTMTDDDWDQLRDIAQRLEEPLDILNRSIDRLARIHRTEHELETDLVRLTEWYPSSLELKESLATLYTDLRLWPKALETWRTILSRDPNRVTAHLGMGRTLWQSDRRDDARMAFRRALEAGSEEPRVYAALRDAYAKRLPELRDLLAERTLRDNQNATLFNELARIEDALGMQQEAATHRERATVLENWGDSR